MRHSLPACLGVERRRTLAMTATRSKMCTLKSKLDSLLFSMPWWEWMSINQTAPPLKRFILEMMELVSQRHDIRIFFIYSPGADYAANDGVYAATYIGYTATGRYGGQVWSCDFINPTSFWILLITLYRLRLIVTVTHEWMRMEFLELETHIQMTQS